MRLDNYSNPVFNEKDLFDALYKGYQINPIDILFVEERTPEILNLEQASGVRLFEPINSPTLTQEQFDSAWQERWNMPDEYKQLNIEQWILEKCNNQRVQDELAAFKERNMLDLLRWLKYFVDTCRANNIVWGVGRGSSVASYILYLIGVHKIDSLKYNLDWQEFLR
jgi:DNA polymerase III alpha subunit